MNPPSCRNGLLLLSTVMGALIFPVGQVTSVHAQTKSLAEVLALPEVAEESDLLLGRNPASEPPFEKYKELHAEAQKLYLKANKLYQAAPREDRAFDHIPIESGRRDPTQQLALYTKFVKHVAFEGPDANPANRPGFSPHEFGVAVDVWRGADGTVIAKALEEAGWKQAVEGEGWHFEAQSIPSWKKISQKRTKHRSTISLDIAATVYGILANEQKLTKLNPDLEKATADLVSETKEFAALKKQIAQQSGDFDEANERYANARKKYAQLKSGEESAKNTFVVWCAFGSCRCPNGQPYEKCDHPDIKAQFDKEQRDLKAKQARTKNARVEYQPVLDQAKNDYAREKAVIDKLKRELNWDQHEDKVAKAKKKKEKLTTELSKAKSALKAAETKQAGLMGKLIKAL